MKLAGLDAMGWSARGIRRMTGVALLGLCLPGVAMADQWMKPTAEELAMTSLPKYPGASALYLFREEITRDDLHVVQHYERIKILSEKGKDYANVELGFVASIGNFGGDDKTVGDISGRTIHADGTIIPFTGKPYLKMMEKGKSYKYQARVFTLPDVQVGSIIEYRYATRYNDMFFESPDWYLQGPLFVRSAHFVWYPTSHEMQNEDGQSINSISWFPVLPEGVSIAQKETPGGGTNGGSMRTYEVSLKDVPPAPDEEYMPPIQSFTYRVLFSFTPYRTHAEFWKGEGKRWSKKANSFIGPDGALTAETQPVIAGATTPDEKLRKIYAAVMELENTDYTRDRNRDEEKAAGLKEVHTAVDVLRRKRGDSRQLTYLFVGMARAAGLKAYAMLVPDRANRIFVPNWMDMYHQLSNTVAIVNLDGKDQFFAPGEQYTPYGHLQWEYTLGQGVRQTDSGTDFANTPGESYKSNRTSRIANLTMASDGLVKGPIDLKLEGSPALYWRQQALRGDEESLRKAVRESLEEALPKTLEIKIVSIENLKDYEKPLMIHFEANGVIGTTTGKRMVVPVDLFAVGEGASFPQEKRELPVYFHYPQTVQDALRINLPASMTVEAAPANGRYTLNSLAAYDLTSVTSPSSITVRRNYLFGEVMLMPTDYPALRTFYSQFEAKDQESIVLKASAPATVTGN